MWIFYLVPVITLIIGLVIWILNKKITWLEWIGSAVTGFILAVIFHLMAFHGLTDDIETWSGRLTHTEHYPKWIEEYQVAIYRTETYYTGSGPDRTEHTRRVFSHYETRYDTHQERWFAYFNYGEISDKCEISQAMFNEIKSNFGSEPVIGGKQGSYHAGHFDGGDNNIYRVDNKIGYLYPVTTVRHFENRIKAAPTVFSFPKVPTNCAVYEWPENSNRWVSGRLIGESKISLLEFDRMNTRLGPIKFVNVIMINFGLNDASIADWQQAKWMGGRKNDLVLCYGQVQTNGLPTWARAFGWSESEIAKRNLETILLTTPINNDILPKIEQEIKKGYIIKDWDKFSYITIEPPTWAYITYFIVVFLVQFGLWIWFNYNKFKKR